MAFENFWRRDRHAHESDRNRGREPDRNPQRAEQSRGHRGQVPDRGYGLGAPDDAGFQRRGWREGSDYYGNNDERYGAPGFNPGSFNQESAREDYDRQSEEREYWRRSPWNPEDDQSGQGAASREGVHYGGPRQSSVNQGWNDDESRGAFGSGGYGRDSDYGRRGALGYGGYGGMGGAETGSSAYGADEQFRGRGPRGYRRSDERIRDDVCEALTDDPYIDASNMEVTVKDCEVTLSGSVNSRDAKRRAESLVEECSGVKDVHNTLRVVSEQRGEQQRTTETRGTELRSGQSGETAQSGERGQSGERASSPNQVPKH